MQLRPYQQRAVDSVLAAWQDGASRVCLVLPTGAGKTVTAKAIADQLGGRALWLVHRTELADQSPGEAVTIQSLLASERRPDCDVLICDECHHYAGSAEQWHAVAAAYPRILGLTATPQRHDGSALGDLFDHLVVGAHYSELLAGGWLVPCRVFRPVEEVQGVAEAPVSAWQRLAGTRQGFAFFSRVEFAQKFAAALPGTAAVWGDMPPLERADRLARFRAGSLRCLANVQILTEGVDVPEASVALLASAGEHAGSYLQRVGRILRPAPGKTDALLIDLPGASHRWGLPTDDREYSLSGKPIRCKTESVRTCQSCGCAYLSVDGACPECGFIPEPEPARLRVWSMPVEEVLANAAATPKDKRIARYKQRWQQATHGELAAEYQRLAAVGAERGYNPKWAAVQYRIRTGRWPDRSVRG